MIPTDEQSERRAEKDADFWQAASSASLNEVWDNEDDDVYAKLLAA